MTGTPDELDKGLKNTGESRMTTGFLAWEIGREDLSLTEIKKTEEAHLEGKNRGSVLGMWSVKCY